MSFSTYACISLFTPALLQTPILRSVWSLFSGLYRRHCLSAFITFTKGTHPYRSILRTLKITIFTCPCYGLCRFRPCTSVLCTVMSHHYTHQHCGLLQVIAYDYICTSKYLTIYMHAIICLRHQHVTTNIADCEVACLYTILQYLLTHLHI